MPRMALQLLDTLQAALRHEPVRKTIRDCVRRVLDAAHRAAAFLRPAAAAPRIAVVSMWDEGQSGLAAITSPNKAAYCRRHGYDWLPRTSGFAPGRPVAWSKIPFIRDALADHDWVFWSDVDSLVMDPSVPLESLLQTQADLVITEDVNGINSGSFLLRRCEWSRAFLDALWSHPDTSEFQKDYALWTDRLWENRAFWHLLRRREHHRHLLVLPQRQLNSYPGRPYPEAPGSGYRPGDFILHLPGLSNTRRVRILTEAAARVGDWPRVL